VNELKEQVDIRLKNHATYILQNLVAKCRRDGDHPNQAEGSFMAGQYILQ